MKLSTELLFVFFSWALLLGISECASRKLRACLHTKDCPDSGTICKTSKSGTNSDSDDSNDFTDEVITPIGVPVAFDPITDTEKLENGMQDFTEESASDEQQDVLSDAPADDQVDLEADVVEPSVTGNAVVLKSGVKVEVIEASFLADSTLNDPSSQQIQKGTLLRVNGWKCEITDIKGTGKPIVAHDALNDFNGSFNKTGQVPSDAVKHPNPNDTKLAEGKFVFIGPVTCKVLGADKLGKVIKKELTSTIPSVTKNDLSTSAASSAATIVSITLPTTLKKLVDSTISATLTSKKVLSSTVAPKQLTGRCVCDADRRFGCMDDSECFSRFQNKDIQCTKPSKCPSVLGLDGYCRMKSTAEVQNDARK